MNNFPALLSDFSATLNSSCLIGCLQLESANDTCVHDGMPGQHSAERRVSWAWYSKSKMAHKGK